MKREQKNRAENTIDKAFKGFLYPKREQKDLIEKTFGCCRYVFNRFDDGGVHSLLSGLLAESMMIGFS